MQILGITWKWNVPNALSVLRILLIPVFTTLYLLKIDMWAFGVLLLSGITDFLDGMIARRCGLITDCGKVLDPVSDKLTQVAVLVCLATRYVELLPLMGLCLVKEACQAIGSVILLKKCTDVRGAKWFGKVSTVVFYTCMLAIVLWNDRMAPWMLWSLVALAGAMMLVAFAGYLRLFVIVSRAEKAKKQAARNQVPPVSQPEKG